jgi:hypothetical protein
VQFELEAMILVTQEYDFNLGSGFVQDRQMFMTLTHVFQLKMQLWFVRVSEFHYATHNFFVVLHPEKL